MAGQDRDGRRGRQDVAAAAESSVPLLETKAGGAPRNYVEGCPGCAVDRRKAADTGIPYGSLIYVWVVVLCTGQYSSSITSSPPPCIPNLLPSSS
jgi:hypothetical protein